jgi:hypothetical protein
MLNTEKQDAFDLHNKKVVQALFREREVDNLQNLIYGTDTTNDYSRDDAQIDSNRFAAPKAKLQLFTHKSMKKLVKKRFVTGQGSD